MASVFAAGSIRYDGLTALAVLRMQTKCGQGKLPHWQSRA